MEISGMLSELKQNILLKDYPELNNVPFDIHLIDGLPTVLAPMSKASQEYTAQSLQKMAIISRNRAVADLTAGPFKHFNGFLHG